MDAFKFLLILIVVASIRPLCTFIMLVIFARTDNRHETAGHPHDAHANEVMHLEQDLLEHDERVREEAWAWDDACSSDLGDDDGYF